MKYINRDFADKKWQAPDYYDRANLVPGAVRVTLLAIIVLTIVVSL